MRKKRPKFVKIHFIDHHRSPDTWAAPTKPEELRGAKVEIRGYIISENDEVVEISNLRPLDGDDGEWGVPFRVVKSTIFFRSDLKKEKPSEV